MDALANLEYLSLVQSTMNELVNYLGDDCADKTLAEFIVSMHEEAKDAGDFKSKLQDVGGDQFNDSLISNLNRLISTMHPKYKKKNGMANANDANSKAKAMNENSIRISALSLPDGAKWKSVEEIVEEEQREKAASFSNGKHPITKDVDDLMNQLENVGEKRRSMATPSNGNGYDRSPKRSRRVSVSPPRASNGRPRLDDKPVLFKIYNGKISGVRDFGAFVALEGIAGRAEGNLK